MPGDKITMLPEAVIDRYTLAEGHAAPALSLYLELRSDLTLLGTSTRLERVPIAANLRLDALDRIFTEEALQADEIVHSHAARDPASCGSSRACSKRRAAGPSSRGSCAMDYSFYVDDDRVRIVERRRGAPIDKLVAELMIFVNTEWGRTLAEHGAPGIYRAQSGGRVKLTTVPAPHDALGVDQYLWASSPLRRYVDFVNQRQLLAVLQGEPLPYGKGSETLLAVMRDFEIANDAYFDFQRSMERYWCLRWLLQENVTLSGATVARENLVKLDPIPLIVKVPSLPDLPPMTRVEVEVGEIDLLDLTDLLPVPRAPGSGGSVMLRDPAAATWAHGLLTGAPDSLQWRAVPSPALSPNTVSRRRSRHTASRKRALPAVSRALDASSLRGARRALARGVVVPRSRQPHPGGGDRISILVHAILLKIHFIDPRSQGFRTVPADARGRARQCPLDHSRRRRRRCLPRPTSTAAATPTCSAARRPRCRRNRRSRRRTR